MAECKRSNEESNMYKTLAEAKRKMLFWENRIKKEFRRREVYREHKHRRNGRLLGV